MVKNTLDAVLDAVALFIIVEIIVFCLVYFDDLCLSVCLLL